MTYASNSDAFDAQKEFPNVVPIRGDIRDASLLHELFASFGITDIVHFAAETHVDNSIADPLRFIEANVVGTATLLNAALLSWRGRKTLERSRFHHISTDEVYGSLPTLEGRFTEETPYSPNSPYSASKAAADHLVCAYGRTYGLNVTISHCSNNYGPWQHREKLIPKVIRQCLAKKPIPIYGTGSNIRDWLWVEDHCRAVDAIFHRGRPGEIYNVGGRSEKTNLEVAQAVCALMDKRRPWENHHHEELIEFVEDRPGHDFRYSIDPKKIKDKLGWMPSMVFETGIERTVDWYLTRAEQGLFR